MLPTTAELPDDGDDVPAIGHNGAPAPRRTYGTTFCPECGTTFVKRQPNAGFCCTEHQAAFHNRSSKRGRVAIPVMIAWRSARNRQENKVIGKNAFRELCRLAGTFATEDREAGRPSMVDYTRRGMYAEGLGREDREHREAVKAAKAKPKTESV